MRKLTNPRVIKVFRDGCKLTFSRGKIDDYMVSIVRSGRSPFAPTDEWLFLKLSALEDRNRTMTIIFLIAAQVNGHVSSLASVNIPYQNLDGEKLFSIIAAMMIAEEKKKNTYYGKMIKVLGCCQVLEEGFTPHQAANWSRGRHPSEITERMKRHKLSERVLAVTQPRLFD